MGPFRPISTPVTAPDTTLTSASHGLLTLSVGPTRPGRPPWTGIPTFGLQTGRACPDRPMGPFRPIGTTDAPQKRLRPRPITLSVSVGPSTTRPGRPPWPAGHFHDWPADRQCVSRPSNGSISTHRHPCLGPRHDSDLGRSLMFLSVGPGITRPGRTSLAGQAHTHLASRQAERESTGTHMALARCSCRKSCPHHTRRGIEPALSLIFPMPAAPVVSWHNFRTLNPIHIRRGQSTGIY